MQWFVKFVLEIELPSGDRVELTFRGREALRYLCGPWEAAGAPRPTLEEVVSKIGARFLNSMLDLYGWTRVQEILNLHCTNDSNMNVVHFRPADHPYWPVHVPEPAPEEQLPRTLSALAAEKASLSEAEIRQAVTAAAKSPVPAQGPRDNESGKAPESTTVVNVDDETNGTEEPSPSQATAPPAPRPQRRTPLCLPNHNHNCSLNAVIHCIVGTANVAPYFVKQLKTAKPTMAAFSSVIRMVVEQVTPSGEQLGKLYDEHIRPLLV